MITEDHRNEIAKLLKRAADNEEHLTQWENDFVSDFAKKLEEYDTTLRVSDKQQEIFDRIGKKLDDAGV